MQNSILAGGHEAFRARVREFVAAEITPHRDRWEQQGIVGREVWRAAGRDGLLGLAMPPELGGSGIQDPRAGVVLTEELAGAGAAGHGLSHHVDVVGPYLRDLGTPEQRRRWLPGFCSGELVTAFAAAEAPAAEEEIRTAATPPAYGEGWILTGHKPFVTNGMTADLVVVAARTAPEGGEGGVSLLVVERGMPGFARSRNVLAAGPQSRDTADLFFTGVHVPRANLLGDEGGALRHMARHRPAERLAAAAAALASAESVFDRTTDVLRRRGPGGRPLWSPAHVRRTLAELATELAVGRAFVDRCAAEPDLDAATAAMAGWWCTDLQRRVVDQCLELRTGCQEEHPVVQAYLDTWSETAHGGTAPAVEEIAAHSLGDKEYGYLRR